MWIDSAEGESFYAYNGGRSFSVPFSSQPSLPPNQLWQFTPSGNSGNWSLVNPPASSNFTDLVRGYSGIYADGGGFGFALGGMENKATTQALEFSDASIPIPGLVMYNDSSQKWYNVSASGYSHSGVALDGAAHFVPSFGPAGLLFIFGGTVAKGTAPGTDTVSMFDPLSQQWSSQEVSGTTPDPVVHTCVVGVKGDDDTYEVSYAHHRKVTKA